jgi:hypothetical protein
MVSDRNTLAVIVGVKRFESTDPVVLRLKDRVHDVRGALVFLGLGLGLCLSLQNHADVSVT